MAKVVNSTTPFNGTINTVPPLPIAGTVTVVASKESILTLEVALEADVDTSLVTLFPAFPYISGAYTVPGTLIFNTGGIVSIPLATKSTKDSTAIVLAGTLSFDLALLLPAQLPPPPSTPDPAPKYTATVTLAPTHSKFTSA